MAEERPGCVADTSWLYAMVDADDAAHDEAVADAETRPVIHIPYATLVETLVLIKSRHGVRASRRAVDFFTSKTNIRLGSPDHDHEAILRVWDAHPALGYVDACGVASAQALALGLTTFDQRQDKAVRRPRRRRSSGRA